MAEEQVIRRTPYLFYFLVLFFSVASLKAQVKSENIQILDGVKFYIHKIEKGQSLYSISKLYNVTLDEIYAVNPDVKAGTRAGQEIRIPVLPAAAETAIVPAASGTAAAIYNEVDTNVYKVHRVLKKETIYSISRKYNISETELKIFNPALISQSPKEGQVLIVGEKRTPVIKAEDAKSGITHPDSVNRNLIVRPKKNSYNVALLLPFKLNVALNADVMQLVKNRSNFPPVPSLAIDFYLGFKAAADSLNGKDFELNIDLYDIDDKDSLQLAQLNNDPKFRQVDFIFGPLYASGFKSIAHKARELGIPVVSPLTQQNKMLFNNPYVSKTNPSQFTLLEALADYCMDSLRNGGNHIILVQLGSDSKELAYVKAFKKYYNDRIKSKGLQAKDSVSHVRGISGVKAAYVPNVRNIVVNLSNNQVQITDFTTQLAIFADKRDITLCGWQSVAMNDNLDQEYLNQLRYTFPFQYNLTHTSVPSSVIDNYKFQQGVYPGEYFFIGYDIANYYLGHLKERGSNFIFSLNQLPAEGHYMRFNFVRPDNLTGFDNRGVYIFRYNNYHLEKTGWK